MDYQIRDSAEFKCEKDRTLAEKLSMWRIERPDEWKMDEFIREAKELEAKQKPLVEALREMKPFFKNLPRLNEKIEEALKGVE